MLGEDKATGGNSTASGNEHIFNISYLVARSTANLPHGFCNPIHPVYICLPYLPSMCVDGKRSSNTYVSAFDEILSFSLLAESKRLKGW